MTTFMGLGVDEIRRRGAEDDKPLRMVKTILHELCKLKVCNSIIAATSVCHCVSNSSLWFGLTISGKATNFSRMSSWHACWKQTANDDPFPGWQGLEIKEHMRDIPQNCDPASHHPHLCGPQLADTVQGRSHFWACAPSRCCSRISPS